MKFENNELKLLDKFRMYVEVTKTSYTNICNESNITAPTLRTIMKDREYIPTKNVRDKINLFMNNKLLELKELINS